MPKNKRPAPRKSGPSDEEIQDAQVQQLCDLSIGLAEQEVNVITTDNQAPGDLLKEQEREIYKIIKKSLQQKKDDVLYESLDRLKHADTAVYQLLKARIEEAAEVVLVRRDEGITVEINAFLIPLFVRTLGGLDRAQAFQDQNAFDLLTQSLQKAQLESPDASVVLVSYAYHLDEIDSITYSHLNAMIRDAFASMTDKKVAATPAIEDSFTGWPESKFGPDDMAVELRFLLGFTLKSADDAFYHVPEDDAAIDAYFEVREKRFQSWTEQAAPLVRQCLVTDGRKMDVNSDINFLYQDLFHGGKERGIAEYFMLQMMSELNHGLSQHELAAESTIAIIGPAEAGGDVVLRVNLYKESDGSLVATSEKPSAVTRDLDLEIDDTYDALMTIGVKSLAIALKFDVYGQAVDVQAYAQQVRED
ncbi:DUF2863 family protein [Glaciimonas immobilis]|uniref:DUF2863 family protein n=1 Tax=Glaciimonas immobilis TaxID=728004 RepID=A0A840RXN4_9BURK|nr:DUF2863 family protein [Glaciimonas immobilis]KAF3998346.1 DUF2863 family protein [Glaciimonas immobilis]MBB5201972.1 hypothetical protein [Glaciimonas immobilis]